MDEGKVVDETEEAIGSHKGKQNTQEEMQRELWEFNVLREKKKENNKQTKNKSENKFLKISYSTVGKRLVLT